VSKKEEYTEIDKQIDIEEFRDSVLYFFSTISDPREQSKILYRLDHLFFIILSANIAGAN
jgi:hypothetical protein